MMTRTAMLAGGALGALLMAGSAQASVTTHKKSHHHTAAASSNETVELREEVEGLKAQLHSLASRLDAQTQAQQQTQAQAQAAQSQALTAQTTAQAAQNQVQADASTILTIPAQVDTATKKAAPKPGWWNDTKIGVTMFSDVSNINNRNDAGKTAQSGTDYDIKRLYLIIDHKFNDTYSFNVTTDFTFDSNNNSPSQQASLTALAGTPTANEAGGANTASGIKATQLYFKKAYLQAHYSDAFNVRLGASDMPWIPFVEAIYGYRYVEQTLIDRTKFGTSSDWGLNASGSMFNKFLNYSVSVVDGEGYKQPAIGTANRTHAVDVEGRANINYKGFIVAVGGYGGKLGKDVQNIPTYQTAQRFDALAAYTDKHIRFGVEYLWARYWSDVTQPNPAKTNETDGYSVFGSYNFTPKLGLFGKYEWVKPKANTVPGENDSYFNVGLSYKPITPLDFALVYKRDSVVNGSFSTGNGVIGIPTGATAGKGTYDEIGLFTQVKF